MLLPLIVAASLLGQPPGEPQPTVPADPRVLAQEVVTLVEAGQLDEALELIEIASRESPDPVYMFMRASLEEQLGRCDSAVALYREFLRAPGINERDQEEALAGLDRCGAEAPKEPVEPEPAPPPPVLVTEPDPPEDDPPVPQTQRRVDPWGVAFTSVGLAVAATGAGLWGQALADTRGARDTSDRDRYVELSSRAERFERTGVALVSVGAAIAVGGIVRLVVVRARSRRTPPARTAKK